MVPDIRRWNIARGFIISKPKHSNYRDVRSLPQKYSYILPMGLCDRPLPTYTVSGTRTLSRIV